MSEAEPGPKPEHSGASEPSRTPLTAAQKKDRWVAVTILGVAFALSLVVSWRSGEVADGHELLQD
jgi:hypothetical protein